VPCRCAARSSSQKQTTNEHDIIGRAWGALACLIACAPAWSAGFDLATGPSVTSSGRTAVAVFASVFGEGPDDGRAHVEPIATLGWVGARNTRRD
jgi:hypothetical protein